MKVIQDKTLELSVTLEDEDLQDNGKIRLARMVSNSRKLYEVCKSLIDDFEDCIQINARGEDKYSNTLKEAKKLINWIS